MASEFKFDLNRVKYREILEFARRDPNAAANPQTEKRSREIIARCLVEWPFDAEISDEALLDLGLRDYLMRRTCRGRRCASCWRSVLAFFQAR